jgi:hypothetical protein
MWRRSIVAMTLLPRLTRRTLAFSASVLVAGCGGGVYLEFGGDDDLPPVIDLSASASSARAGDSVRLAAAAADENGIDHVSFYRFDGNTAVRIGSDGSPPYEWQLLVPADGRSAVTVFARAVDYADNVAESDQLTISITP